MLLLTYMFRICILSLCLGMVVINVSLPQARAAESNLDVGGENGSASTDQAQGTSLFSRNPVHLSLTIDGGYDTNINTTKQQQEASAFTQGEATLAGTVGTERAHATINSALQLIYYTDQISGPNPEVNTRGAINAAYSVSRRLMLGGNFSAAYQVEPDFSANIGPQQRVGYFFTTTDDISASFQWFDPLSTVTSGNIVVVRYDDATIGFDQDRIDGTIGQQVRWGLARGALVGEYRFQIVDYDHNTTRNSTSHYALGGIDYPLNERLNVTLRGGATFRFFDDGTERTAPRAEGTVNYSIGSKSSLSLNGSYGLEQPDDPLFQSRTTFRTGLQFNYWVTAHLLSTFTGYYSNSRNTSAAGATVNGSPNEQSYSVSAGLQYSFTSRWGVHATFDYSGTSGDTAFQNYSRERYSGGVVVSF
jgi:Putative beta-barrel porin 2